MLPLANNYHCHPEVAGTLVVPLNGNPIWCKFFSLAPLLLASKWIQWAEVEANQIKSNLFHLLCCLRTKLTVSNITLPESQLLAYCKSASRVGPELSVSSTDKKQQEKEEFKEVKRERKKSTPLFASCLQLEELAPTTDYFLQLLL